MIFISKILKFKVYQSENRLNYSSISMNDVIIMHIHLAILFILGVA